MNKFLRVVENNLPGPNTKMSHGVLMDITDMVRNNSELGYFIKPERQKNPPMEGDTKETGIIYVENKPKFKITITPIVAEDAEDADIIGGGIKTSTQFGPVARKAADKLSQTAARRFGDVEKELASRKPKTNII